MNWQALLTPRNLSAGLGLIAAFAASGYVITRLAEAAKPMPTTVRLLNTLGEPVALLGLTLSSQGVVTTPLTGTLTLPARQGTQPAPEWDSKPLDLAPGLPLVVKAAFAPPRREAVCTLDARPQGQCTVRAGIQAADELACEYDCKAAPTK